MRCRKCRILSLLAEVQDRCRGGAGEVQGGAGGLHHLHLGKHNIRCTVQGGAGVKVGIIVVTVIYCYGNYVVT